LQGLVVGSGRWPAGGQGPESRRGLIGWHPGAYGDAKQVCSYRCRGAVDLVRRVTREVKDLPDINRGQVEAEVGAGSCRPVIEGRQ
jgi:hypothetical protein